METPTALNLEQVPHELVEAGVSGRLVVVVGPGANVGTGLPTWKALLNLLLDRARTGLPPTRHDEINEAEEWFRTDGEELLKASLLRQMMGEDGLATAIADVLRRFPAAPAPIHRALAELPGATFITTNYDALLEAALADQTTALPTVVRLSDIDGLRRLTAGQVLKLHGDIDHPKTIVLSSEDYLRARNRKLQETSSGRAIYRQRVAVEHCLAHIAARKGASARYIGVRKNLFDLRRASAIQNLEEVHRMDRAAA